ncbi:hypothetical protein DXG01_002037 [Tephrocybe rancida]|nr:hypothetical protein DXG01_002037 [Tephrocybe rancida]
MALRDAVPRISLDSAQSVVSVSTNDTDFTVPGPGSLTGKALKALGELTLRSLDRIVIYKRMRTVPTLFPHTELHAQGRAEISQAYDELLELSRPGLYDRGLRNTAVSILVTQVKNGHIHQLVEALGRWHPYSLEVFLQKMLHMTRSVKSAQDIEKLDQFEITLPQALHLMARISTTGSSACQVVLSAGFLGAFANLPKEDFRLTSLSDIYGSILYIYTRPGHKVPEPAKQLALQLLVDPITTCASWFIEVLSQWDGRSIAIMNKVLTSAVTPTWYSQFLDQTTLYNPDKVATDHRFVHSLLITLSRVAAINETTCQAVVQSGYLDIYLESRRNSTHSDFLQLLLQASDIPLAVIRDGIPTYSDRDIITATYLWAIERNYDSDGIEALWRRGELIRSFLVGVRTRVDLNGFQSLAEKDQHQIMTVMKYFCRMAKRNKYRECGLVVREGYLDALLYLQKQGIGVHKFNSQIHVPMHIISSNVFDEGALAIASALDSVILQVLASEYSEIDRILAA